MKLYFVRHPQTSWNKKKLFQGRKEGRVTKEGKLETEKFISSVKDMRIDTIYYADNKRCEYLTKELLKIFPMVLFKKDKRINERSFGEYEGISELKIAEITNFNPSDFIAKYKWRPQDGESLEDISIRVKDFLGDIKCNNKENDNIFVITSGGVMKVVSYVLSYKTLKEAVQTKYKNLDMLIVVLSRRWVKNCKS